MKSFQLTCVIFIGLNSLCLGLDGHLRLRAREHFEWLFVKYGSLNDTKATYFGTSNTINFWFEKPGEYALGLAAGPVIGGANVRGRGPAGTNTKIRLYNIGLEAKLFVYPKRRGLFTRLGLTGNILDTRGSLGAIGGAGYYVGLGWEIPVWKIGVVPEFAFRHVFFDDGSRVFSFTPSIALHFYIFSGDWLKLKV